MNELKRPDLERRLEAVRNMAADLTQAKEGIETALTDLWKQERFLLEIIENLPKVSGPSADKSSNEEIIL